jgi:hypothetical protein
MMLLVDPQQVVGPAIGRKRARSVHVLRDDVAVAVLFARIVDRQDVRMLQHADHVRFGEKHLARDALAVLVPARLDVIYLDGHVATVVGVVREIHDARAAAAYFVDDHVLADLFRQRCATILRLGEMGTDIGQGCQCAARRQRCLMDRGYGLPRCQTVI